MFLSYENLSHLMLTVNSYWNPPTLIEEEENGMVWSIPQIISLLHYVLRCSSTLHIETSSRLDHLAVDHQFDTDDGQAFFRAVVSLIPDELVAYFTAPNSDKLENLKRNEILAAFISFLLEILGCKRDLNFPVDEARFRALRKELRFVAAVLGDAPLRCVELEEEVEDLLIGMEAKVNEVGRLLHSFFFTTDRVLKTGSVLDASVCQLLGSIRALKDVIEEHCIKFSSLETYNASNGKIPVSCSVFNVIDALYDGLFRLIETKGGVDRDLKDGLEMLRKELVVLRILLLENEQVLARDSNSDKLKEQLKVVIYEAQCLIDIFVIGDFPVGYVTRRLPNIIHKVKQIGRELEKNYKKEDTMVSEDLSSRVSLRLKRSPTFDDVVIGFEREEIDILDQVVGGPEQLQIVSITGMPGLGKTTLVKKLYNDPSVLYRFDRRVWCVVSHMYKRKNVLKTILMSLITGSFGKEEQSFGDRIYRSLKGRRYLIVLDDVWSPDMWGDLKRWFPDDRNGSRIIFTSRNKDVVPLDSVNHELALWSNERCWKLLEKKLFNEGPCPPELRDIGRQIAAKCYGLPLTIVATAGTLAMMDKDKRTWEQVEQRMDSYVSAYPNNYVKILELSYKHLPDHLKPCFLYLGAFPEYMEISVPKLISLWIAEGFVESDGKKRLEDIAQEYLMELINRSLVLITKSRSRGGIKSISIHDLLRDLCLKRAKEENFLDVIKNYAFLTDAHRLCVHPSLAPSSLPFGLHVKSLLWYNSSRSLCFYNMKLLKVLDLMEMRLHTYDDLENLGKLVHLRYLAINTIANWLPKSIGNLGNLEFLLVKCHNNENSTCFIASILLKMDKLKYLRVRPLAWLDKSYDISQQNNLEFLSFVCLYERKDEEIWKNSPHLRKLKCVVRPKFVKHGSSHQMFLDLSFLTQLESLNMEFEGFLRSEFMKIKLPPTIHMLTLSKIRLPWEKMSTIGKLPNLVVLKLESNAFEGNQWDGNDGDFQQLKFLKLDGLNFVHWNASKEYFPRLERLVLRKCGDLEEIPSDLGNIPTLRMIEVERCNDSVVNSVKRIKEEQDMFGNEELKVIVDKQQLKCQVPSILKFRDGGWEELFDKVIFFCVEHNIEILDMDGPLKSSRGWPHKGNLVPLAYHYRTDIFDSTIKSNLEEMNHIFNEKTMDLLRLSAVFNPSNIINIGKLVEELYPEDFTHQEKLHISVRSFRPRYSTQSPRSKCVDTYKFVSIIIKERKK